jgi:hypothetical protein
MRNLGQSHSQVLVRLLHPPHPNLQTKRIVVSPLLEVITLRMKSGHRGKSQSWQN